MEPLLEHLWSGNVLTEILDRTLIKLTTRGLVARLPAKNKRSVPAVLLTSEGRRTALASLNVSQLPAKPKPTWAALKKSLLLARSLGLPAGGQALSKGAGFKAAVLKQKFGLPLGDYPDLKSVKAELTRKLLGMGPKEKITLETVQAAIFGRELGEDLDRPTRRRCSTVLFPDRLVPGAMMTRKCETLPFAAGSAGPSSTRTGNPPFRHPGFRASFRRFEPPPRDVFRDGLVTTRSSSFMSGGHFRTMRTSAAWTCPRSSMRLAEANNARLLDLSRADLVQAMDPDDVRLSEVIYLNAAFHFIRIGSERH